MRIKYLPWIFFAAAVIVFSSSTNYPTGAPAGVTGSPGDGSNCTSCHGGTATTTAGKITSNIPASGYIAGQTYQITATNPLTGSGKMGFEVSPQNAAGTQLGTLVAGSGSKLVDGTKYITHSNANTTTNTWTFNWIAPAAGTGAVTFYGAFARNNPGPVTLSSLTVQEGAAVPPAAGPITGSALVCVNTTETYSVGTISGATSYVWTAPAGASIMSGQGTTSISVYYNPASISSNISVYGTNTAGSGAASNKMVTVNSAPAQTSSIAGNNAPCQASSQTYSVSAVSGVSYAWNVPAGSVISSGQGTSSINVTMGANSGDITVVPSNTCGSGVMTNFTIASVGLLPSTPSTPTGPTMVNLQNTMMSDYSTSAGADSYEWQISPAAAGVITGTTATAQVMWNAGYIGNANISVKGVNACGLSNSSPMVTVQVLNTTSLGDDASGIRVMAGESNGYLTFEMNTNANQASVMILDLSGRVLLNTTIAGQGSQQIRHQLKAGVYIVVVEAGTSRLNKKILVIG